MKTAFRKSFQRDLKNLKKDREMRGRIRGKIEEVEASGSLQDLPSVKKLSGGEALYRIRVGDYRIGIAVEQDTVVFVRCLHRREIYRYFP
ncbi:MAG: type II toxin-antitoxin system RelE/ParE family toxin [Longimonas sp.]|uniref:type II toxin-antitoxin system RelE family toxin n=1 Tax=Longimonas sp. TaxID=2039626 RepID=UPI003974EE1F